MNYITATDLRTKTVELIETLKRGEEVSLIHRSKVIAIIKPIKKEPKPFDINTLNKLRKLAKNLNLPKTTPKQGERIYRSHLVKKYKKGLS